MSIPCAFSRSNIRNELKKALSGRNKSNAADASIHSCGGAKRKAVEFLAGLLNNNQT
jgi:hypothetical protein